MTDIEKVRLLIGDTGTPPYLTDAQIQFFLDTYGSVTAAAAAAARALAAFFATLADQKTGDISTSYSKRAEVFRGIADDLDDSAEGLAPCYTGGISVSELESSKEDTDLVQPAIRRKTHETVPSGDDFAHRNE